MEDRSNHYFYYCMLAKFFFHNPNWDGEFEYYCAMAEQCLEDWRSYAHTKT